MLSEDYLITEIADYTQAPRFFVLRGATEEQVREFIERNQDLPSSTFAAIISGAVRDEVKKLAKEIGIIK